MESGTKRTLLLSSILFFNAACTGVVISKQGSGTDAVTDSAPGNGTDAVTDSAPGNGTDAATDSAPGNGTDAVTDSGPENKVMSQLATMMDRVAHLETELAGQKTENKNVTSELKTTVDKVLTLEKKLDDKSIYHESQFRQQGIENRRMRSKLHSLTGELTSLKAKSIFTTGINHPHRQLTNEHKNVTSDLKTTVDKVLTLEKKLDAMSIYYESQFRQQGIENRRMRSKLHSLTGELTSLKAKSIFTTGINHPHRQLTNEPAAKTNFVVKVPVDIKGFKVGTLKFQTVEGNNYNKHTGEFTAPKKGIYVFHFAVTTLKIGYTDVRLDGTRVMVKHNGKWGTVCNDKFGREEVKIICHMLGYSEGYVVKSAPAFPWLASPIWMDEVGCRGRESTLSHCPHRGWGLHNCHHGEDVSVACFGLLARGQDKAQFYVRVNNKIVASMRTYSMESSSISTVKQLNPGDKVKPTFYTRSASVVIDRWETQFSGYLLAAL